ncbi:MAG: chitobiase/beta-hexosaminidase C-terminal domain-containing protein, partial [Muribaculaceae bacterium]|nr:chitobiase/beta-hexosaminidase C-terminal domain-containing protein [Muribaculaceae bacterium]
MKKKLLFSALLGLFSFSSALAADYNFPADIQKGNILHCFNWKLSDIKAELPNIAAAGFGSVQVSPLQRAVPVGEGWSAAYRPYDFKFIASAGLGSADDLRSLCTEAAKYGIKVIVDVVENHVDGHAAGNRTAYHDPWWNSNDRLRWYGSVNDWNDRGQVTKHQMGGGEGYPDVNSEDSEVAARGKAYIEELKSMGVKGIRFDAAKHVALPSEGCQFWATVTSVPGLYYYGEILDGPGGNGDALMKEYTKYMSVTDNNYGDNATKANGIPGGHAGWCAGTISADKVVYWGESHDTYANNDGFSKNLPQDQIDRGYAIVACRNNEAALYLSRPSAKGFNEIKIGAKGSTAFKNKQVAEVNKFRNAMVGRLDYFSGGNGVASVTRKDGGAVIVINGSGSRQVSVANGGGYCPAGTYTDRVHGGTFTVTATTITGTVGQSGIAVIYNDGVQPPVGGDDPIDPPVVDPTGSMWILGNIEGHQWTPNAGAAMTVSGGKYVAKNVKLTAAAGETKCFFNITDALGSTATDWNGLNMAANRYGAAEEGVAVTVGTPAAVTKYANNIDASDCKSWTIAPGTYDFTLDLSAMTLTVNNPGGGDDPIVIVPPVIDPDDPTDEHYIYYDGTFSKPCVWAWTSTANCNSNGKWPGDAMTKKNGKWYWAVPAGKPLPENLIISEDGGDKLGGGTSAAGEGDLDYVDKATYHQDASYTAYQGGDDPVVLTKPVVSANPGDGTTFTDETLHVTLSVSPEADIYYSLNGAATTSSTRYTGPIAISESCTLSTLAVAADGGKNSQTFRYTKQGTNPPIPPTPVQTGKNLITDYYKVNPNGQSGTFKTVNMTGHPATNAFSNWGPEDLIAQGVARDVCQAFKGVHERPVVDSYALYAAYDNENLYLGVQFVYTVWDIGGEGKQPGESKPYNMDGHMVIALDLDPNKSFDGYIGGKGPIWNESAEGAKFDNGVDAVIMCSTKPGVGTPGLFIPTPDGHASYDKAYCKDLPAGFWGYKDGLLPSIEHVWGQDDFSYDPELLKGNTGFIDLRSQIDDSAHTFYEFKLPLSSLGITADHIRNQGIGVMYLDKYGSSPVGGTPYDPSYFDNVSDSYSQDPSSSKEKEDEDLITYSPARVGYIGTTTGIADMEIGEGVASEPVYFTLQGVRVANP